MPASGSGRGRGWLGINNTTSELIRRPGGVLSSMVSPISAITKTIDTPIYPVTPSILMSLRINLLDAADDGIVLNNKLKHIIEEWQRCCASGNALEECYSKLYTMCLYDAELALKLVTMMTTRTFVTLKIHDVKLRNLFIASIQKDFESSEELQIRSPVAFRNSVRMLGEFFHKIRFQNGIISLLAAPALQYLEMLLESGASEDLKLFTQQLYLNGSDIKAQHPEKFEKLLVSVRLLLSKEKITETCRVWLLLAMDVVTHQFGLFPSELHTYYKHELGEQAMAYFNSTHNS